MADIQYEASNDDGKNTSRSLFGLGKKRDVPRSGPNTDVPSLSQDISKLSSTTRSTTSPTAEQYPVYPSSPPRGLSTSPRLASPAGSQIFERDVQESTALAATSPAIPGHLQTDNYIPSVLGDASEAITNGKLDPDTVEIVTHTSHQPVALAVAGGGPTQYDQTASDWVEELDSFANRGPYSSDNASNYGSLDSADVRRLSFISFADVVQGEHGGIGGVAGSRDSVHMAGLTSLNSTTMNRSPSPIRSPMSSQTLGTSPPTSNPGSIKGVEMSPHRKPIGLTTTGELNIETMSQALRRTGSADLSTLRSGPVSPIEGPGAQQ
ncbi:hypothetical protein S7711_00114 [Stachybotrys chartarum IBT 7711]|uniref:Uncharacterized protein n=1 Tax=Stachybotrys chartarum (strain CBS 109288 / IBT 7711) TaxID=1280523 RepID=A0A084B3G9_STACB|nr:hypothetical protein S7711_00114 [Stachybotrys chartarum IBT 7711]KFA52273.1 hypothetical protein S40293_00511 [Stachybotrys chartarum IBT 40293]